MAHHQYSPGSSTVWVVNKANDGTLVLSGSNTFTGDLTIAARYTTTSGTNDAVDVINNGIYDVDLSDTIGSLSGSGNIQLASGITLSIGTSNTQTFSGSIDGSGNLAINDPGTLILDGADVLDSYAGNIEINEATLRINTDSGDVVFNGTFGGIDGNIAKSGSGSLTLTSNVRPTMAIPLLREVN